jgi:ubiquinone/menaquinone biosynthesis C-methylase UbiE
MQGKKGEGKTSWGKVAGWYSEYVETTADSYQKQVILPNLLRILGAKPGRVLDIACGQGFFTRAIAEIGAAVTGADISKALVEEAKRLSPKHIPFYAAPAHTLMFAKDASYDTATIVLAVQNIEDIGTAFAEAARILAPHGRLVLVIMHPAFRNPQKTSWGWDEDAGVQYRRVDSYLSASRAELVVHPGRATSEVTISYHRSLQDFSKALTKAGFGISRIEEWVSHKKSAKGPRQKAEDHARHEFPLFMMIEAFKR